MKVKTFVFVISTTFMCSCSIFFSSINFTPSQKVCKITFLENPPTKKYQFYYPDTLNNSYLRELRQNYGLDKLVSSKQKELEKIKTILHWSSSQWEHNGNNTPSKPDALTILKEAENGNQFRCVEYGIVVSASLNSIGIPARTVGLKTRDVKKVKFGTGHVVAETYSSEFNKWIYIDPQFDVMPFLNDVPLNAVEFQKAIVNEKDKIKLVNQEGKLDKKQTMNYIGWVGKYLYFFNTSFDQRVGTEEEKIMFDGKSNIMLVPVGEENPTIFQRNYEIDYCIYSNSINDFYRKPI